MTYSPPYRLGPAQTPKPLKVLIFATLVISLLSALCDSLFPNFFGWISPQKFLSLSVWGVHNGFIWQFLTYLFVQPITHGVSFSLLLYLAFNSYLLWVIGALVIDKKGLSHFFFVYLLGGAVAGLSAYFMQTITHSPMPFAGNWTALYALLVTWIMIFPDLELLIFLTLPIKAKYLVTIILGATLLIDLSIGDFVNVFAYCTGGLFGYFYSVLVLHLRSPLRNLNRFEGYLMRLTGWSKRPPKMEVPTPNAKIYDFKTGKAILNDEEFMDAMLTKISTQGQNSLTFKERLRLRRISKMKKNSAHK